MIGVVWLLVGCFVVADCDVWLVIRLRCGVVYCCGGKV